MKTAAIVLILVATVMCQEMLDKEVDGAQVGRAYRTKRATCWGWDGGDDCRHKCQRMVNSCTGRYYATGYCEGSWIGYTCNCKPKCIYD